MTVVTQILDRMSGITKPQRKFLVTLLLTLLGTRPRLNFLNRRRHSAVREKTFRRHFQNPFAFAAFTQSAIAGAVAEKNSPLFAQDATFSAKRGKQPYGLEHFWNGCASTTEKGLEVSRSALGDLAQKQSCARSAEQTPPQPEKKQAAKTGTRIDFYRAQLQRPAPYFPASSTHGVFDGAYAKRKFGAGVCRLGYAVVRKLRSDAALRYRYQGVPGRRGRPRKYAGKVEFQAGRRFAALATDEAHITLYTQVVWSVSLQRAVRGVGAVNRKAHEKPRQVGLFAPDTELEATAIFRYYKARVQIEFIFREAKQCAGFSEGPRQRQRSVALSLQRLRHARERGRASWRKQNSKQRRSCSSHWRAANNARAMNICAT